MGEENAAGAPGKAGEEADQTAGGFTRTLSNFGPKSFPPFRPQVTLSLKQNDHYLRVICHQVPLTAHMDDKVSLFCFVSFFSTARIISGASKNIFSLN